MVLFVPFTAPPVSRNTQVFYNRLISKMHLASEDLKAPVASLGGLLVSASFLSPVIIFICSGP